MKQHSKVLLLCVSLCVPISNTIAKPMSLTTRVKIVASGALAATCAYFALDSFISERYSLIKYLKNTAIVFAAGFAAWKYYAQTPHGRLFRAYRAEQRIYKGKFQKLKECDDEHAFMQEVEKHASQNFFIPPLILEDITIDKNCIIFIRDMIAHIRNDAASDPDLIEECASLEEKINTIEPTTDKQLAWIRSYPNIQAFYNLLLENRRIRKLQILALTR